MITQITFFKFRDGVDLSLFRAVRQKLLDAATERLIKTGRMTFYENDLRYVGPEIKGRKDWDRVVMYQLRDLDALEEWSLLPEHVAVDHAHVAAGAIEVAFGFQLTDDFDPVLRAGLEAHFVEMGKKRDRFPRGLDRT